MENVYGYYGRTAGNNEALSKKLGRRMYGMGTARLVLVLACVAAIVLWPRSGWEIITAIVAVFAVPFIWLMIRHNKLSLEKDYADRTARLCRDETAGLDYDFSAFDGAADKISADHPFSLDLDIFGDRSLFQSLNRTVTYYGREKLSGWLTEPLSDKAAILRRQDAVRELSRLTPLRQHFFVTGSMNRGSADDADVMGRLASSSAGFADNIFWKVVIWAVPAVWVVLAILYAAGIDTRFFPGVFFLVSVFLAYAKVWEVNKLQADVGKMEKIFSAYSGLVAVIEDNGFDSELLRSIKGRFEDGGIKASRAMKELSGYLNALEQRANLFVVFINILTIRDMWAAIKIEQWKKAHCRKLNAWFDAIGDFDALLSLGGFAFNHPGYAYPEIADSYFEMNETGLGHPLLNRDVCVLNDIRIERAPCFMIITGANMAGKSTYLRTVGVNFLLSCAGAAVCADSLSVYPASLVTSLRTSDSLTANESYFYAELKRLKGMIDRLKAGAELFIILDEILKGTNSEDKQKGSLALVRQFVSYRTCGIIATHDLVLGGLHDEYPEYISNYRFEAEISGDRLSFSYRLQDGIAQNLNAYFLMRKMGITLA